MRLVLLLIFSLLASNTYGQDQVSKIDKNHLKQFVKTLTTDSLEGRAIGSLGNLKAQHFISQRFNELGLQHYAEKSYLESFGLKQTYWDQVYLETSDNERLFNFDQIVLHGSEIQNNAVEKEVIFGGTGTDEELNQIDVTDRLVLVFLKNMRAYYNMSKTLANRNAYGVIVANPDNEKQFKAISNTFKNFNLKKRYALSHLKVIKNKFNLPDSLNSKSINAILIPNNQIKPILGFSSGKLNKLIRQGKINEIPISKVKVKFERIINEIEAANIIGTINGKSNKTIVLTAHYDHLKIKDKTYYPGADDNASGVAALLELAEEYSNLKDLEYNMMFIATSAEEAGLLGSLYHVNKAGFNSTNIICNINIDMIGRKDEKHSSNKYLYAIGLNQSPTLDSIIKKADELYEECSFDYSLNSTGPLGIFTRSDQYNFYKKGIPSIFFHSGIHVDYHQPTDTYEKIDYQNLENRVKQISQVIQLIQSDGL